MEHKSKDYDYMFKMVLVGNSGVGKSNLLLRFVKDRFNLNSNQTTSIEYASKVIEVQ